MGNRTTSYEKTPQRTALTSQSRRVSGVICRVGLAERSVGELVGWVGEDGVPPVEQFVGVAFVPDGVVACAETRRDRKTDSAYYAYCAAHHLPDSTDLVILEFDSADPNDHEWVSQCSSSGPANP
jgi:hypothetical protein